MVNIKIVNLNLQSGIGITKGFYQYLTLFGRKHNRNSHLTVNKAADFLNKEQPDLIILTEIDAGSRRSNFQNQISLINEKAGVAATFFSTIKNYDLYNMGNAIVSNHPIIKEFQYELPGKGERRVLGEIHTYIKNKKVIVFVTHLSLIKKTRVNQLKEIAEITSQKKESKILAGDFNTTDIKELDILKDAGFDLFITLPTYPSWNPFRCLEYIFFSKDFTLKEKRTYNKELFSDHLPIISEVELN